MSESAASNGQWIIEGGETEKPDIWLRPLNHMEEIARVFHGHTKAVRAIRPLHASNNFLSGSEDGTVRRWQIDLADTGARKIYIGDTVDSVAFASNSNALAVGLRHGDVLFFSDPFDVSSTMPERHAVEMIVNIHPKILARHPCSVGAVHFTTDAGQLLSVDEEGLVRRYHLGEVRPYTEFRLVSSPELTALAASDRLLACASDRTLFAFDSATGTELWRYEQPETMRALVANDSSVFAGCRDGSLRRFDAATGRLMAESNLHRSEVSALALSSGGQRLATVSADRTVRIVNAATLAELSRFSQAGGMARIFWIDNDKRLLVLDSDRMCLLNPLTGQCALSIPIQFDHSAMAINRDGRLLAARETRGYLTLLPLGTAEAGESPNQPLKIKIDPLAGGR